MVGGGEENDNKAQTVKKPKTRQFADRPNQGSVWVFLFRLEEEMTPQYVRSYLNTHSNEERLESESDKELIRLARIEEAL